MLGVKKRLVEDDVWNQLIKEVDTDGNGEISFDEFKTMMTKLVNNELSKNLSLTHHRSRSHTPTASTIH